MGARGGDLAVDHQRHARVWRRRDLCPPRSLPLVDREPAQRHATQVTQVDRWGQRVLPQAVRPPGQPGLPDRTRSSIMAKRSPRKEAPGQDARKSEHEPTLPELVVDVVWGDITKADAQVYAVGHYVDVLPQWAE